MNVDKLHSIWMDKYRAFALSVLGELRPANVISYLDVPEDDMFTGKILEYSYDGDILVPKDSAAICQIMARFAHANLGNPPHVKNLEMPAYPKNTYNLWSLLMASYPRHVDSDVFRGDNLGIFIATECADVSEDMQAYMVFGGLGVILMESLRVFLGETKIDSEILEMCKEKFVILPETSCGDQHG